MSDNQMVGDEPPEWYPAVERLLADGYVADGEPTSAARVDLTVNGEPQQAFALARECRYVAPDAAREWPMLVIRPIRYFGPMFNYNQHPPTAIYAGNVTVANDDVVQFTDGNGNVATISRSQRPEDLELLKDWDRHLDEAPEDVQTEVRALVIDER